MVNYKTTLQQIQLANAKAFAEHTRLVAQVKKTSLKAAIPKSICFMLHPPLQICDHRIVLYLIELGIDE